MECQPIEKALGLNLEKSTLIITLPTAIILFLGLYSGYCYGKRRPPTAFHKRQIFHDWEAMIFGLKFLLLVLLSNNFEDRDDGSKWHFCQTYAKSERYLIADIHVVASRRVVPESISVASYDQVDKLAKVYFYYDGFLWWIVLAMCMSYFCTGFARGVQWGHPYGSNCWKIRSVMSVSSYALLGTLWGPLAAMKQNGVLVWNWLEEEAVGRDNSMGSYAICVYLCVFLLIVVGLVVFMLQGNTRRFIALPVIFFNSAGWIMYLCMCIAFGDQLLGWIFIMGPVLEIPNLLLSELVEEQDYTNKSPEVRQLHR